MLASTPVVLVRIKQFIPCYYRYTPWQNTAGKKGCKKGRVRSHNVDTEVAMIGFFHFSFFPVIRIEYLANKDL